jgi:hypothetical protein
MEVAFYLLAERHEQIRGKRHREQMRSASERIIPENHLLMGRASFAFATFYRATVESWLALWHHCTDYPGLCKQAKQIFLKRVEGPVAQGAHFSQSGG